MTLSAVVHRGEQGGQLTAPRNQVHLKKSVDGREQGVRCQGAGVRLGGPKMEASGLASSEASAAAAAPRRALATLVSTSSGVILAVGSAGPPPS